MKRPLSVTILLWLVLSLTAWGGLRLWSAIRWWDDLQRFGTPPGAAYLAVSGGVGLAAGLLLLWGMWRRKPQTRIGLLGTAAGLALWYWCERLLLQTQRLNWPFSLGATVALLVITATCVWLPETRIFFLQEHSRR